MYFDDLSPYKYNLPFELAGVLNIGWLDDLHTFRTESVEAACLYKLKRLALRHGVNQMRGAHVCQLCRRRGARVTVGQRAKVLGSAEIWIPSLDRSHIFAAPDLVVHYIEAHQYAPPDVFLKAVSDFDEGDRGWNGEHELERLIAAHYQSG